MATSNFTEFNLPRNAYTAFDAVSLKQLIVNRLKDSKLFPDIDYEGSNISSLVDIVAYTYHVLMFYLNQTASEAMFSQVELYENMNKLVSLLGYKPHGFQTAALNFDFTVDETIDQGFFTLKRYSYAIVNNIPYSFINDISFEKTVTGSQLIESVGANHTLQQGRFKEYPLYTAIGESYEQFTLIDTPLIQTNQTKYVDHNNIYVYVRDVNTEVWHEWIEVTSLYIAGPRSAVFEKRLNENGRFEIKFGNGVTGQRLNNQDIVAVYYLESDGSTGVVSVSALNNAPITLYNTQQFSTIFTNVSGVDLTYLDANQVQAINLNNKYASISPAAPERLEQIKQNAPQILSTQNRAITVNDYISIVSKNFSNIVSSVKVISNKEYTSEYLRYFYDIGLESPNVDERVLLNQVSFNDACDFNNVYIFAVPAIGAILNETTPISLFPTQKQAIVNRLNGVKSLTHNVVVSDVVYRSFDIGLNIFGERISTSIRDETKLRIIRSKGYVVSKELLKSKVAALITEFFAQQNNQLGTLVDLNSLNINILNIPGIDELQTIRTSNGIEHSLPKISMLHWDPFYPNVNVQVTSQNVALNIYQFPFFYEISNLINKIEVI